MLANWIQAIIYSFSILFVGFILLTVNWSKIIKKSHAAFGVSLYIIVSLALGYGVGSLIVKVVNLTI